MTLPNIPQSTPPGTPFCVTMGNFDGVHLGHQRLIKEAHAKAHASGLGLMAVTFWPHPALVLHPEKAHAYLTTREEKFRLLQSLGVNSILEIPFDLSLAALSPEEFTKKWLLPLNVAKIVIGHDFSFGRDRIGALPTLEELGKKYSFSVFQIKALVIDGAPASSTRLRQCVAQGDMQAAKRILGRPYSFDGKVEHGVARGRTLGFPTANLRYPDKLLPAFGVYVSDVHAQGKKYRAVTNVGDNPTFNGEKITVESFLLDADVDLYDQKIQVDFLKRLRSEKKFASSDDLVRQISQDMRQAKTYADNA